ncbi:DMT family transporter [Pyxidicoccus caerfyrddinensis]|jgi:drug/metabolite transporter (DMT)-like permease|uniref:DMT family transporter n=1 Tax=Pyxidicoccus caerfyrddinensis TaxID=2709663 RepID=UPI0013D998C6|nr:EamA family transporter [Pyxidicoccus caerfyrddinensis]
MNRTAGFFIVALSGACFGALGLFGRLAYAAGADAPSLLFLRFSLAGAVLASVMVVRRQRLPERKVVLALILLGAVGYVSEAGAYFIALQHAPAGLVALLLYSFPALVALLQRVVFGERLGRVKWLAVALALGGTALTADVEQGGAKPLGIMLGLLSALLYACYVVISARVAGRAGPLASSTVILGSAGVTLGLVVLARGPAFPTTPTGWAAVVALALVSTVAAVLLFFVGMARIGPVNTSLVSTMEPLTAVLLGALFLDERLSARQGVGGLLILTAAVLLARSDAPDPSLRPPEDTKAAGPG